MPSVLIGQRITGPQNELYIITDFLGRGAFGEVYRAQGESTGAVIAVKLLPLGQLSDDTERRALLNEVRAAQQINHPNVVRVLHVDEGTISGLGPYVCMEYVSGGTLARLLRAQSQAGSQIPMGRAIEMLIDIGQGVRAINERLIHRDIKPDNILIEAKTLKIGDFGISNLWTRVPAFIRSRGASTSPTWHPKVGLMKRIHISWTSMQWASYSSRF